MFETRLWINSFFSQQARKTEIKAEAKKESKLLKIDIVSVKDIDSMERTSLQLGQMYYWILMSK